jgi:predicted RNase H-like HicB family nuclease
MLKLSRYDAGLKLTSVIQRDGDWFIAQCPEVEGANGQGKSVEECRANLWEAVKLILEDRSSTSK